VLRQDENHFSARYVLALCHLRTGRWLDGKAELTVCLASRPEFIWPRLLRGFAASELGARAGGPVGDLRISSGHVKFLALALGRGAHVAQVIYWVLQHAAEWLESAEYQAAEEDLTLALKQDRDPAVQYVGLTNRGVLNIRRQRWANAVADLRQAVKVNPGGFQAYVNLGQAFQAEQKWEQAQEVLDQAIERAPHLALLYESRAQLHLRRERWAAARADFERAIDKEPRGNPPDRLVQNLVELGQLLHRDREYPAALARYDRALRLKPEFVSAQRFRAETLRALKRPTAAGQALDRYLAVIKEPAAGVYRDRGLLYAGAGKFAAAIEMYTLALRQDAEDTVTRRHRGWTYLLEAGGAVLLALEDFETCLRADRTNADALAGRGNARIGLRQLDGAVADAKAAAKHGPVTARLLYNLTRIYAQVVGQLEAEVRTAPRGQARQAADRLALYKETAFDYLRRTLEKQPRERQPAFWRKQIEADPAFAALRRQSEYVKLAKRFAGTEK
jgi:tetratricopeptide (TPR) repeat protein